MHKCSTAGHDTHKHAHSTHQTIINIQSETQNFPSVLWHCWLGNRKDIQPVKDWVLVCWWWLDWSLACLVAPVVTSTSIILSSNKIQDGDISGTG